MKEDDKLGRSSGQEHHTIICQNAVATLRTRYDLSLKLISELSGYSPAYISHVFNGDYNGSRLLAKALTGLVSKFEDQLSLVAASSNANLTVDEDMKKRVKQEVFEAIANYPHVKIKFIRLPNGIGAALIRIEKSNVFVVVVMGKTKSEVMDQLIHELKAIKGRPSDDSPDVRRHKPDF